jgi:small subunit ribosomal protein S8
MVTDPISDLIIRIKNGSEAGKPTVEILASKFAENVAQALKKAGYLSAVEKKPKKYTILLGLVYFDNEPRIHGAERISKPSRRVYVKASDLRTFKSGYGNAFLSTPQGIMSDAEAKKHKTGGEILFRIW